MYCSCASTDGMSVAQEIDDIYSVLFISELVQWPCTFVSEQPDCVTIA